MDTWSYVDLLAAAVCLTVAIYWLRRTKAGLAALFLLVLGALLGVVEMLGLGTTAFILRMGVVGVAVALAVAFRHELRLGFERAAAWLSRRPAPAGPEHTLDVVARAVERMAEERMGALLVLPGRQDLAHYLTGGVPLDAEVSEEILLSIFEPRSPGHDGAVIVDGNRLSSFSVHLPLSQNRAMLGRGGTRHAAALGLAERSDATCIVVSEERGEVSIAHEDQIRRIEPGDIGRVLHLRRTTLTNLRAVRLPWWRRGAWWVDVSFGVAASALLWFLVAPGVSQAERVVHVPVEVVNLPEGYEVQTVDPEEVEMTIAGPRAALYMSQPDEFRVLVDGAAVGSGRRWFRVSRAQVKHPESVVVRNIDDGLVRIEPIGGPAAQASESP